MPRSPPKEHRTNDPERITTIVDSLPDPCAGRAAPSPGIRTLKVRIDALGREIEGMPSGVDDLSSPIGGNGNLQLKQVKTIGDFRDEDSYSES